MPGSRALHLRPRRYLVGGGEEAIAGIKGSCEHIRKAAATILQSLEVGEQEQAA